jgi:hypothetical protein
MHGRSWLLAADYTYAAKDRVAVYPKVTFKGVRLGVDAKLPLAFFRSRAAQKYEKRADGELVVTQEKWSRLSFVELTGNQIEQRGETFLEARGDAHWMKKSEAVVPEPRTETPWGAAVGGADTKQGPAGRRTWMDASVWQGWLIAYEGTKPVYATMIAPGRGGTPERGKPAIDTASTPTGTFKITGKFATRPDALASIHPTCPGRRISGPHALHGAYWPTRVGQRMAEAA